MPGNHCSVSNVQDLLEMRHRDTATLIPPGDDLPLELWGVIYNLLGREHELCLAHTDWARRFQVMCGVWFYGKLRSLPCRCVCRELHTFDICARQ